MDNLYTVFGSNYCVILSGIEMNTDIQEKIEMTAFL